MPENKKLHYELIFSGQCTTGADIKKVRNNAAKLFKASPDKLDKLFSGTSVVLKNNLDEKTAESYIQKLKMAGMICKYRPMKSSQKAPTKAAAPKLKQPAAPLSKNDEKPGQKLDWSLAPAGANFNPLKPKAQPDAPNTSHLSLSEQSGYLVDSKDTPPPPPPDTSHLSLE